MNDKIKTLYETLTEIKPTSEGFKLLNLINAKDFVYDDKELYIKFKVSSHNKINTVIVKLNSLDLYDIELWNCRLLKREPYFITDKINTIQNIYFDQLADIIYNNITKPLRLTN